MSEFNYKSEHPHFRPEAHLFPPSMALHLKSDFEMTFGAGIAIAPKVIFRLLITILF
jgi:hypothetical protein